MNHSAGLGPDIFSVTDSGIAGVRGMISAEEQKILASLSEVSADIRSHLTLISELTARRCDEGKLAPQQLPEIVRK